MSLIKLNNKIVSLLRRGDTTTIEGREHERARRIALTALSAAISKVLSTIIPFITIRLTLEYLGVELYGLWNAVTSFFALFTFADLGLGNGLQTQLSRACGQDDIMLQRKIIFNSYAILSIVCILLSSLFILFNPIIDWVDIMNAQSDNAKAYVSAIVLAIILSKLISIPLSLIQRIQLAYQEGYNSNWWQCIASVFSLICIVVICRLDCGKIYLIWVSSLIPVVIFLSNSLSYYSKKTINFFSISLIDKDLMRNLLKTGSHFFILSILTTLGLAVDTFIVANVSSLCDATPFSILHKIACFISIVVGMLCTPLWSANGEALARGENEWVQKNTKKMVKITIGFSTICSTLLILCSPFAFKLWLGNDFEFSIICLIGMCITQIILSGMSPYFMILNAAGIVKKQVVVFTCFTIVSIILKFTLAPTISVNAIPWITNICYIIFICPFIVKWAIRAVK